MASADAAAGAGAGAAISAAASALGDTKVSNSATGRGREAAAAATVATSRVPPAGAPSGLYCKTHNYYGSGACPTCKQTAAGKRPMTATQESMDRSAAYAVYEAELAAYEAELAADGATCALRAPVGADTKVTQAPERFVRMPLQVAPAAAAAAAGAGAGSGRADQKLDAAPKPQRKSLSSYATTAIAPPAPMEAGDVPEASAPAAWQPPAQGTVTTRTCDWCTPVTEQAHNHPMGDWRFFWLDGPHGDPMCSRCCRERLNHKRKWVKYMTRPTSEQLAILPQDAPAQALCRCAGTPDYCRLDMTCRKALVDDGERLASQLRALSPPSGAAAAAGAGSGSGQDRADQKLDASSASPGTAHSVAPGVAPTRDKAEPREYDLHHDVLDGPVRIPLVVDMRFYEVADPSFSVSVRFIRSEKTFTGYFHHYDGLADGLPWTYEVSGFEHRAQDGLPVYTLRKKMWDESYKTGLYSIIPPEQAVGIALYVFPARQRMGLWEEADGMPVFPATRCMPWRAYPDGASFGYGRTAAYAAAYAIPKNATAKKLRFLREAYQREHDECMLVYKTWAIKAKAEAKSRAEAKAEADAKAKVMPPAAAAPAAAVAPPPEAATTAAKPPTVPVPAPDSAAAMKDDRPERSASQIVKDFRATYWSRPSGLAVPADVVAAATQLRDEVVAMDAKRAGAGMCCMCGTPPPPGTGLGYLTNFGSTVGCDCHPLLCMKHSTECCGFLDFLPKNWEQSK